MQVHYKYMLLLLHFLDLTVSTQITVLLPHLGTTLEIQSNRLWIYLNTVFQRKTKSIRRLLIIIIQEISLKLQIASRSSNCRSSARMHQLSEVVYNLVWSLAASLSFALMCSRTFCLHSWRLIPSSSLSLPKIIQCFQSPHKASVMCVLLFTVSKLSST